jgi:hypothetical protein
MNRRHLFTSSFGTTYTWEDNPDGSYTIQGVQDVDPLLDVNKAMATHNDGYTPSRDMRRVASIPMHLIKMWKQTEGWNALDPDDVDKLKQKLNDPDWLWLRTAPGRV